MSTFPLLKLPESSVDTIVKQMEFHEIVKLCICSNQSAKAVKRVNPTFPRLIINFSHDQCNIWLTEKEYRSKQLNVTFHKSSAELPIRFDTDEINEIDEIDELEEYRYEVTDPAQKIMNVARLIMDSMNIIDCWYAISPDNIENLKEYVTRILVEDYNDVEVCGRKTVGYDIHGFLDSEELTFLMNTVKKNAFLNIMSNIPTDFRHEKAVQFKSFHYIDDRFLTLDDLKSIRNVEGAFLSWTHFNWNDINQFLHYWMTCDEDMMRELFIYVKWETVFNESELLRNLTSIKCQVDRHSLYYIKARNDGSRKCTVGQLHFDKVCLRFKPIEPKSLPDDVYKHLEDIEKIQKLSRVKVDIENLGFEYQKMLENEKCDIEKGRIQRELEIVERTKHGINGQLGLVQNQWKPFLLSFLTGALRVLYPIGMNAEVVLSFDESD